MNKLIIFIYFVFILLISCSPNDEIVDIKEEIKTSLITNSDLIYDIDDFIKSGWKENKKLDNSNFQSTDGIWYGFFNRRDAEIWIYDSHSSAIDYGVQYAEEAINKRPTNRDPTNPTSIRYHAYLVTGNAMILCEDNLEDCIELLNSIK